MIRTSLQMSSLHFTFIVVGVDNTWFFIFFLYMSFSKEHFR